MQFLVARFIRVYGAAAFRGAWPTGDGGIPFRLFFVLFQQIPALEAGERIEAIEAGRMAEALSMAPKDPKVRAEMRRLAKLALPLISPPDPE